MLGVVCFALIVVFLFIVLFQAVENDNCIPCNVAAFIWIMCIQLPLACLLPRSREARLIAQMMAMNPENWYDYDRRISSGKDHIHVWNNASLCFGPDAQQVNIKTLDPLWLSFKLSRAKKRGAIAAQEQRRNDFGQYIIDLYGDKK